MGREGRQGGGGVFLDGDGDDCYWREIEQMMMMEGRKWCEYL